MALGQVDYGLFGIVGGLTAFISFFNSLLATSIGRFYAFSIGEAKKAVSKDEGMEKCRRWFNVAVFIHTVVPAILLLIGYPVGAWVIRNWLSIPPDRVWACIWVFRFVCASCFVAMVNVPFMAMFTAKQYIAELTLIITIPTALHVAFMGYVVTHPGDWLVRYGLWVSLIGILPNLVVCARAFHVFPECRLRCKYLIDWHRLKQLGSFAGWQTFGMLSALLRVQGTAILVNKYFGPRANSALSVSRQVDSQALSLSVAMEGALHPAITTACGMGDMERMRRLAYRASKLGMAFLLFFALPLGVEIVAVLKLWLGDPPPFSAGLCILFLVMLLVEKSTVGQMLALNANGKIAVYQAVVGSFALLVLPLAWLFIVQGCGIYSVGYASVLSSLCVALGRVFFARHLVGMSARYWFWRIVIPVCVVSIVSVGVGLIPQMFMTSGLPRILVVSVFVEVAYLSMTWLLVLDVDERSYVTHRIRNIYTKLLGRPLEGASV